MAEKGRVTDRDVSAAAREGREREGERWREALNIFIFRYKMSLWPGKWRKDCGGLKGLE